MKGNGGFSLIELLVVVAIVALLSSTIFASTRNVRERARITRAQAFASTLDHTLGGEAVGAWTLDEGSGTSVFDSKGPGYVGTLYNSEVFSTDTPMAIGSSLALNGINQYIDVANRSDGRLKYTGGELTLSAWVKPDPSDNTIGYIISKPWNGSGQYNYWLRRNADGTLLFQLYGASTYQLQTTAKVPAGKWSHVAASVDSNAKVTIYIDGYVVASGSHSIVSWTPPSGDTSLALAIGTYYPYQSWAGNTAYSFYGLIDEPRLYVAALTQN